MICICVASNDPGLANACRVILCQLIPESFEICREIGEGAQVYIWDAESDTAMPEVMRKAQGSVKLVIAPKQSLVTMRSSLPPGEFSFIQSPWTMLSLQVFLSSIASRFESFGAESPNPNLKLGGDRVLQKLLEANARVQENEQNRINFLMRAIHDIRVPLMASHGYCGLLLAGQMGDLTPDQRRVLDRMKRSLARLSGLTDSLMNLGGDAQYSHTTQFHPSSIEASVSQAVHETLPFVEQKGITLNLDVQPPVHPLCFDSGQIEQVLVNLIDNACKFTPKHGVIDVRGYSAEDRASEGRPSGRYRIDIRDTGPGIPAELRERIFDEFASYQVSSGRSGAGLGLAICRMLIDAHQGRIWATSNDPGATFSFELPCAPRQAELSPGRIPRKADSLARAV